MVVPQAGLGPRKELIQIFCGLANGKCTVGEGALELLVVVVEASLGASPALRCCSSSLPPGTF